MDLKEDEDMQDAEGEASGIGSHEDEEDSEVEEEEEAGDPSDFIDVLDVLDGRGLPESEDEGAGSSQKAESSKEGHAVIRDLAESDEKEDEDDEDEAEAVSDDDEEFDAEDDVSQEESNHHVSASEEEDEAEDPDALASLQTFIAGLDAGQKRKAPEDETVVSQEEKKVKKRKFLKERTEAGAENEFAAHLGL